MVFENFLLYSELFTTPIRITEEGFHKGAQELIFNSKKINVLINPAKTI